MALARRGAEDSLRARARLALRRAPRLAPVAAAFSPSSPSAPASWYYYNAHVLNEYLDSKARRGIQANYERKFKQYENLPQPKVTAVDADDQHLSRAPLLRWKRPHHSAEQDRASRSRRSTSPIKSSRSPTSNSTGRSTWSAPRRATFTPSTPWNSLWRPAKPSRLPATSATRRAASATATSCRSLPTTALSSTPPTFPYIGYRHRRRTGRSAPPPRRALPPLEEMAHRGDPLHSVNNIFFRGESDWITYHTVVSTSGGSDRHRSRISAARMAG